MDLLVRHFHKMFLIFFMLTFMQINSGDGYITTSMLCTKEYCESVISENACPSVSENCSAQNATHSGQWLPAPTYCNCCPFCLTHLLAGDRCTQGGLGSPPTGTVCGPGLSCLPDGNNFRCGRMNSVCHSAQDDYDERRMSGTAGFLEERPTCDGKGEYGAVACIPGQTCFCLNKKGERIFGEVINERLVSTNINCGCSRLADTIDQLLGSTLSHGVRCLSNGSFDVMQCIENRCFCVFQETGLMSSNIIVDSDTQSLDKLPCFDKEIHNPLSYLKPCEELKLEVLEVINRYNDEGFTYLGNPVPNCEPDGNYYKIQINESKRVCVDDRGDQIESFGELASVSPSKMNCYCARTLHLLKSVVGGHFLPDCCTNGNWNPVQCRENKCYCVHIDGRQNGQEVERIDKDSLKCGQC